MSAPTPTLAHDDFLDIVKVYLAHLREEISQAQKIRIQVHSAKIIFLGGLYSYALQQKDFLIILIVPFVAFAFDCVIFGYTYNIYELAAYIRDCIEPLLPQPSGDLLEHAGLHSPFLYWETAKSQMQHTNWGRAFSRIGSFAVTILACCIAFAIAWNKISHWKLALLFVLAAASYSLLTWFELKGRQLPGIKFKNAVGK
jgi:hypothetical protein